MSDTQEESVYQQAINKWGLPCQLDILKEELAELIVAISHYQRRKTNSFNEMCGEIADVEIMLAQIKLAVLVGLDKRNVAVAKTAKLKRLKERIQYCVRGRKVR